MMKKLGNEKKLISLFQGRMIILAGIYDMDS